MRAHRSVTCWDYHHGQATRILVAGFPPVRGDTMAEKQVNFEDSLGWLRKSLCIEPRGHRNMIGAIITEPVSPESIVGVLFTKPAGYFSMCGDSAFSVACFLVESGIVAVQSGETTIEMDTVAGPVRAELVIRDGICLSATIRNVPSYVEGTLQLELNGTNVSCPLSYGGLTYALVPAAEVGLASLRFNKLDDLGRRAVLAAGSTALKAAQAAGGPEHSLPPVDLVLWEPLDGERGVRVANFYAAETMGAHLLARVCQRDSPGNTRPATSSGRRLRARVGAGLEICWPSSWGLRRRGRASGQVGHRA